MKNVAVIIPALNPDERVISYCRSLADSDVRTIIVVDDGSDEAHKPFFAEIAGIEKCRILTHSENMGKGRALKDAFNLVLGEGAYSVPGADDGLGGYDGVITADSDGQHSVEDVLKIADEIASGREELILGSRDFDDEAVPPRSAFGNKTTRFWFRVLHKMNLNDTQTGLRGIPIKVLPFFADAKGERFEYELNMLIICGEEKIPVVEIPIKTIYENQNAGTHFRTIADSFLVMRVLWSTFIKYLLVSLSSFVIDIVLFQLLIMALAAGTEGIKVTIATVVARICSSIYNYLMNKKVVFEKKGDVAKSLLGYYILCVCQMMSSAGLVLLVHKFIPIPESVCKIIVDAFLFVINYWIQKKVIFKKTKK